MPALTEQELRGLAEQFAAIADELTNYVIKMQAQLTAGIRDQLMETAGKILAASVETSGRANLLALDEVQKDFKQLTAAAADLLKAVKKVSWPDRVLRLASASLSVAVAISTANASGLLAALEAAQAALKENAA